MVAIDWEQHLPCDDFTHFCLEILEDMPEAFVSPLNIRRIAEAAAKARRLHFGLPVYHPDRVAAAVMQLYREGNPQK